MSDDRRVTRLQDDEVRRLTSRTKEEYGTLRRYPVNIVRCLESGTILTRRGRKKLVYRVCDDGEMGNDDGRTEFTPDSVIISVKRSVDRKARWGDGRSRMTLAHELAHGVLHFGDPLFRESGVSGATSISRLRPEDSAEHQAKVFASAFLIDDAFVEEMTSPEEVSVQFGVSYEAAAICFERVHREKRRRDEGAEYVRLANERFQAHMRRQEQQKQFCSERVCPECQTNMFRISSGLLCFECGYSENSE
jgi:IrrE N-terminal-like domain